MSHTAERAKLPGCDTIYSLKALDISHCTAVLQVLQLMKVPNWATDRDAQTCAASGSCPSYQHLPLSIYTNRVLLQMLTIHQPVKKFLAFYRI
jgi:hypothetical protein